MTAQDDLGVALAYHQQGFLVEASGIYRTLIESDPTNADALHLLGAVAMQQGEPLQAIELMERAIELDPNVAAYHGNLAEAYRTLGQLERAVGCCQTALQLRPDFPQASNNLGLAFLALGRAQAAADQFREALRIQPSFALAENNLGNALRLQGNIAAALSHFRRAVQLDPQLPEVHSNLAQLLLEEYRRDEALIHAQEAVRLRPQFAEAQNNLGNILRELGSVCEAKICYAVALELNPNLAITHNNMGQLLQEEGLLEEAVAWYRAALLRDPNSAHILCNLASALEEQDQVPAAAIHYELALQSDATWAEAYCGLGGIYQERGQLTEAMTFYRRGLQIKPNLVSGHCCLSRLEEELNGVTAAEFPLREALRIDPGHPGAIAQLGNLLRGKLPDADLATLRELADRGLSESKRSALNFSLAVVLDARGEYDEAVARSKLANGMRSAEWQKRGKGYDPASHVRSVSDMISTCTFEFFERTRGFGIETERPVFIFGLPRSGTTLTEQILASHSQVCGAGELSLAFETFQSLPSLMNCSNSAELCLGQLDEEYARQLAQRHLEKLSARDEAAKRVIDKMPDNYLYLGMLAMLFPKARFIHCRRDPRDVAVSCWMTNFRHVRWSCDFDQIASRFFEYRRLMDHWQRVLPVRLLEIDYEETVHDLEGVARRLVDWCGLDWEPECQAFHRNSRPVRTASATQVRQPVYSHSVARWKNYQQQLAPLFERL